MKITSRQLESQGNARFARLFEIIYPDGVDSDLKPWGHRAAVKKRLEHFQMRNREVLVRCEECGKHFLIYSFSIVNALSAKRTIDWAAYL